MGGALTATPPASAKNVTLSPGDRVTEPEVPGHHAPVASVSDSAAGGAASTGPIRVAAAIMRSEMGLAREQSQYIGYARAERTREIALRDRVGSGRPGCLPRRGRGTGLLAPRVRLGCQAGSISGSLPPAPRAPRPGRSGAE